VSLRELSLDDIEALAVGAWVLGTGGGGNPYLPLLNMRALYRDGHRVQLMDAADLADDDWVGTVANMGAPLVGQERLTDSLTLARAVSANSSPCTSFRGLTLKSNESCLKGSNHVDGWFRFRASDGQRPGVDR